MDKKKNNTLDVLTIIGIGLVLLAIPLQFLGNLDIEEKDTLTALNGKLEKFHITSTKDGKRYMRLELISGEKWFSLLQDDLSWKYPELKSFEKGSSVNANITERCCAANLKTMWELKVNNKDIFKYEDIISHKNTVNENGKQIASFIFISGIALLIITATIKLTRRSNGTNNP